MSRDISILVVDHNPEILQQSAEKLRDLEYTVTTASTLKQAEDTLSMSIKNYDVLLTEVLNNDIDDTVRLIKKARERSILTYVITFNSHIPTCVSIMKEKPEDYMVKPVDWKKLDRNIKNYLNKPPINKPDLLLVDKRRRTVFSRIAKEAGYHLDYADDPETAFRMTQDKRYDLVISDDYPYGFSTENLIHALKEKGTQVLIMTKAEDSSSPEEIQKIVKYMKAGACDYIDKKERPERILRHVRRCLIGNNGNDNNNNKKKR